MSEKKIRDSGTRARKIDPEFVRKALGAEEPPERIWARPMNPAFSMTWGKFKIEKTDVDDTEYIRADIAVKVAEEMADEYDTAIARIRKRLNDRIDRADEASRIGHVSEITKAAGLRWALEVIDEETK